MDSPDVSKAESSVAITLKHQDSTVVGNDRTRSIAGVLIVGPSLKGVRQGEFRVWRVETQMSSLPATEPVRFDVKYIVFSSFDKMAA